MLTNKMQTSFSADMQYGGSYGGDLLFGEISNHQRSPGGRIHKCFWIPEYTLFTLNELQPLFNTEFIFFKETRLGKLINDVRKKTKNEDLARRAKKLLRNWQKLIEPGKVEVLSKGWYSGISSSAATLPSGKLVLELKNRNDFNNCSSLEKTSNRKHEHPQLEGQTAAKLSKTSNSKHLLPTGNGGPFMENQTHQPHERDFSRPLDNSRLSTTPSSAIKPHPSALGYKNTPSSSSLKASVLQQQPASASWGQYQPIPRGSLQSPQNSKLEADVKRTVTQAQRLHSITVTSGSHTSELRPFNIFSPCLQTSGSLVIDTDVKDGGPKTSRYNLYAPSCSDSINSDESGPEKKKAQKCKSEDGFAGLDGQTVEEDVKEIRLKERGLTFNPLTGQIKPCLHKESSQEGAVSLGYKPQPQLSSEQSKQNPPPLLSLLQQKDLKNLSRSKIIQSYFSQQSSLLMSSDAEIFTTELKNDRSGRKTHTLAPELPARDLPGISREIATEDVRRLHTQRWPGVNGCYDTKGNWFDWTESITLDPHGDETRLNILPYVSLDWTFLNWKL